MVPYIYTEDDIAELLAAAGRLPTEHRADTYQTLIGLVAVTGMREGEAVRLDRDDVDLEHRPQVRPGGLGEGPEATDAGVRKALGW